MAPKPNVSKSSYPSATTMAAGLAASLVIAALGDCKNVMGGMFIKDTSAKCGPQTEMKVKLNSLTKNVSTSIQNAISNSTTNIATFQSQFVSIQGNCCIGGIEISQTTDVNIKMMSEISNTLRTNVITQIQQTVLTDLKQIATQVNDMLNSGGGGTTKIDIEKHVQNILESDDTKNAVTNSISNLALGQSQSVNIVCPSTMVIPPEYRGGDGKCVINQQLIATIQAEIIIKSVLDVIRNDSLVSDIRAAVTQRSEMKNRGITDIVDSVMDFFKSLNMMIIVVVLGAILLLPVIFMVWKKMKSNKGGLTDITNNVSEKAIAQFLRSRRG